MHYSGRFVMATERRSLVMSRRRYRTLLRELHARGDDQRESGAFLLGRRDAPLIASRHEVTDILYYDDLDATCLTGGITMHAAGMSRLNEHCREHRLRVLGDVHTHPSDVVRQSTIDSTHPMVAIPGHLAFIIPNFAAGHIRLETIGGHHLRGGGTWDQHYGHDITNLLTVRSGSLIALARIVRRVRQRGSVK